MSVFKRGIFLFFAFFIQEIFAFAIMPYDKNILFQSIASGTGLGGSIFSLILYLFFVFFINIIVFYKCNKIFWDYLFEKSQILKAVSAYSGSFLICEILKFLNFNFFGNKFFLNFLFNLIFLLSVQIIFFAINKENMFITENKPKTLRIFLKIFIILLIIFAFASTNLTSHGKSEIEISSFRFSQNFILVFVTVFIQVFAFSFLETFFECNEIGKKDAVLIFIEFFAAWIFFFVKLILPYGMISRINNRWSSTSGNNETTYVDFYETRIYRNYGKNQLVYFSQKK